MSTAEHKAVIKHAEMNGEMQQYAIDCAEVALEEFTTSIKILLPT